MSCKTILKNIGQFDAICGKIEVDKKIIRKWPKNMSCQEKQPEAHMRTNVALLGKTGKN